MESIDIEEMDCDTCLKMQEILREEIDDPEFLEFAIENLIELFDYIATGRVNIRIHRDDGPPTCPYLTVRSGGKDRRPPVPVPARLRHSGGRTGVNKM